MPRETIRYKTLDNPESDYLGVTWSSGGANVNINISRDAANLYCDPLSRAEINKLIRVLRRARDQSFGRDE